MKPNTLLWQLTQRVRGPRATPRPVDDATLIAFREGALSAAEQTQVEQWLADNPDARARLATLAGVVTDPAPDAVRDRLLSAGQPEPVAVAAEAEAAPGQTRGRWALAAAVLGMAILLPFLTRQGTVEPWVGDAAFEVSVEALATTRATAEPTTDLSTPINAYPDTRLTITVQAAAGARDGVEYGVFLEDASGRLVAIETGVEITPYRGAATLSASARTLVAEQPGVRTLWVVVAEEGAMPQPHATAQPEQHLNGPRSRAYRLQLQLLPQEAP
ncbi:MAG: hypothetical protein AAF184_14720 [Pseudomonadota bacterium]